MDQETTLTSEEEAYLIYLMGKVGARMSNQLFVAVAAKFALIAIETISLRRNDGKIEVFLTIRDDKDPIPSLRLKWHSPGTMLRASDENFEDAFARVVRSELGVGKFAGPPEFAGYNFHHYERGPELGMIFVCQIDEGSGRVSLPGRWFDVEHLHEMPGDLIPHHYPLIDAAVKHFVSKG